MKSNYIELKVNRDFGGIISIWFDFFKQNFKKFTNIFISYNGIFLILFVIVSYLLVSGIMGLISYTESMYSGSTGVEDADDALYFGLGILLFAIVFVIVTAINFSISSIYVSLYEKKQDQAFEKAEVWKHLTDRLGSIIGFILLLIPIYLAFFILAAILSIIPLLGGLVQYVIQLGVNAWIGVAFMSMIYEEKGVIDALGEGWKLVMKNFWKSVGINFIMSILIGILIFIVLVIPGVLIGIYTFHAIETNAAISESVFAKLIYTMGACCFFIIIIYSQCLSQFVNGMLYFSLHEKTYHTNLRSKIEGIGKGRD